MEWLMKLLIGIGCVLTVVMLVLLGWVLYLVAFDGGTKYLSHEKVNGIECIVTRNKITNNVVELSCPPVQGSTP